MASLKKTLGLCECKWCLRSSYCEIKIKGTDIAKDLCYKHTLELTQKGTLESITFQEEE